MLFCDYLNRKRRLESGYTLVMKQFFTGGHEVLSRYGFKSLAEAADYYTSDFLKAMGELRAELEQSGQDDETKARWQVIYRNLNRMGIAVS